MKQALIIFTLSFNLYAFDCTQTEGSQTEIEKLHNIVTKATQEELDEELRKSARWGDFDSFVTLLEQGANPHSFNLAGQSAFDIAVRWSGGNEAEVRKNKNSENKKILDAQLAIIKLLLEKKVVFKEKSYDFTSKLSQYNAGTMTIENSYKIAANHNCSLAADYLFSQNFPGFKDSHVEKAAIAGAIEFIQVATKYHPEKEKEYKDICKSTLPLLKDNPSKYKKMQEFINK